MNRVVLFGNIGAEPELRGTKTSSVLRLRLATNERRKDADGNWSEHTEWHSVIVWGKRADALAKILAKGKQVLVEGQLRTTSWEKDGQKRTKTEVHATDVELVRAQRGAEPIAHVANAGAHYADGNSGYQDAGDLDDIF